MPAPAVYQLLGYPGTGKHTVAKEIVRRLEASGSPARLLDNHSTSDLVWSLVPEERRFDVEVLDKLRDFRAVLFEVAEQLTPPDWSLVITNFVPPDKDAGRLPGRQLAEARGCRLVAVVLECEPEERMRRVVLPDRATKMKLVDPHVAAEVFAAGQSLPDWPELTTLDVTSLSPEDAAARIIALASS